jgi:hypothetical protein
MMAFFAGLDSRQENVGSFLALKRAGVAPGAFHKLVGVVIKNRMPEPSRTDIGFRNCR